MAVAARSHAPRRIAFHRPDLAASSVGCSARHGRGRRRHCHRRTVPSCRAGTTSKEHPSDRGEVAQKPVYRMKLIAFLLIFALPTPASLGEEPPVADPLHIVGVGAHPDDVAVGAGGVIASYVKRGHRATILNVTFGETVRPPGPKQEEARRIRRKEGEDIARKLGAEVAFLGWPANTIIPSWEMKVVLVNALRKLQANVILFTCPWDTHADHRNLSAAMKDVIYYVGHPGMAFDAPPCNLRSAWMYSIEADTDELHQPDLLFDVSDVFHIKLASLTNTRPIFSWADA